MLSGKKQPGRWWLLSCYMDNESKKGSFHLPMFDGLSSWAWWMRGGGKIAGISGKDWIRLQQRRRLGDEECISVVWRWLYQPPRQPWSDEETWRLAQLVSKRGMQWAAHARHAVYCTALDCTTLSCTVLLSWTWENTRSLVPTLSPFFPWFLYRHRPHFQRSLVGCICFVHYIFSASECLLTWFSYN